MRIAIPACMVMVFALFTALPVKGQMYSIEGSVEASKLVIESGPPVRVKAFACDTCEAQLFELDENIKLFVNGERVSVEELNRHQGQSGTVIYNLDSGRAVRLRW